MEVKASGKNKPEKNKADHVKLQNLVAKLRTELGVMLGIRKFKNDLKK